MEPPTHGFSAPGARSEPFAFQANSFQRVSLFFEVFAVFVVGLLNQTTKTEKTAK